MLNAICALSLAAASAVGGLSASFQKDRKDASVYDTRYGNVVAMGSDASGDVFFNGLLPVRYTSYGFDEVYQHVEYASSFNIREGDPDTLGWFCFISDQESIEYNLYLNDIAYSLDDSTAYHLTDGNYLWSVCVVLNNVDYSASDYYEDGYVRLLGLETSYTYAEYIEHTKIVPSITIGLDVVSNLAQGLVDGFDAMALDNGALTNTMAFAFTLLGIGCAVGISKKCFNWITGRHGM